MFSFGSASTDHLGFESQLLEVAIRTNDVSKVKHFLMIHRDKFQVRKCLRLQYNTDMFNIMIIIICNNFRFRI